MDRTHETGLTRRGFLKNGVGNAATFAVLGAAADLRAAYDPADNFDCGVVIRGMDVYDETSAKTLRTQIGVKGCKITRIGSLQARAAPCPQESLCPMGASFAGI